MSEKAFAAMGKNQLSAGRLIANARTTHPHAGRGEPSSAFEQVASVCVSYRGRESQRESRGEGERK